METEATTLIDLTNKHFLITGAAGGLGKAVVSRASSLGARLTLVDLGAGESGEGRSWIVTDLLDPAALKSALQGVAPIDALIHLAGGFDMGPAVHETDDATMERMTALNVTSLRNVVRALVPGRFNAEGGAIVTIGAFSALTGKTAMGAYCAAKSMVMRLTESMAGELTDHAIRANSILPSVIDTPSNRRDMPDADFSRWVTPDELANLICFLASDASSGVNGALIPAVGRL